MNLLIFIIDSYKEASKDYPGVLAAFIGLVGLTALLFTLLLIFIVWFIDIAVIRLLLAEITLANIPVIWYWYKLTTKE